MIRARLQRRCDLKTKCNGASLGVTPEIALELQWSSLAAHDGTQSKGHASMPS